MNIDLIEKDSYNRYMEPKEPTAPTRNLSPQQQVLAQGMILSQPDYTLQYQKNVANRTYDIRLTQRDMDQLAQRFKRDPKDLLGFGRQNILNIMRDGKLPTGEKGGRAERYVDAYLDLILKLDHAAFPPTPAGKVLSGIPPYVPDGLTDMGGDPTIDSAKRAREALVVNKKELFNLSRTFLYKMFKTQSSYPLNSDELKKFFIQHTAKFVYEQIPYDHENLAEHLKGTVPLHQVVKDKSGVCRHHALYTQVLLEVLGITSRISKSDLYEGGKHLGPHANNIVRINNKWHVLDSTNPDVKDGQGEIFLRPVPESNADEHKEHFWSFKLRDGRTRSYRTRDNMYYRIQKAA